MKTCFSKSSLVTAGNWLVISLILVLLQQGTCFGDDSLTHRQTLMSDPELSLFVPFDGSIQPAMTQGPTEAVIDGTEKFEPGVINQSLVVGQEKPQKVRFPLNNEIDLKAGTIMFWFKPGWSGTDPTGRYTLLWMTMRNSDKYFAMHRSFSKDAPKSLFINLSWDNALQVDTSRYFEEDRWVHIAATWDAAANEYAIFIDGQPAARTEWKDMSEVDGYTPGALILGDYYGGDNADDPIKSHYDELFILKRPLSAEEIQNYHEETSQKIQQ